MAITVLEKEKEQKDIVKAEEPAEVFAPTLFGNLFADMRRFAEEIDPFFAGFGLRRRALPTAFKAPIVAPWTPNVEMFYTDNAIVVRAELPGVKKEDVKVEVVKSMLTIEGERKYEKETARKDYFATEWAYGNFYRRIVLPETAKVGEAKAAFKDGVLEVTVPVPALEKDVARRLEIKG